MIHLGDITKINGAEIPIVDVITGGSPCQDLSVAGNREGLKGERSGLFMEQLRVVKEMRERDRRDNKRTGFMVRPRYMLWENVAGAFSSPGKGHNGEDFQAVLTEIVKITDPDAPDVPMPKDGKWSHSGCIYDELGRWSIAWRLHDAQFWGVPQRRKRIALVADFGGLSAPEILFERKGLSRDIDPSEQTGEGTPEDIGKSSDESSYTLKVRGGVERDRYGKRAGKGALIQKEMSGTLGVSQDQTVFAVTGKGNGDCFINDKTHTSLSVGGGEPGQNYPCVLAKEDKKVLCIGNGQENEAARPEEVCKPLNCLDDRMKVLCVGNGQLAQARLSEKVGALNCMHDEQAVLTVSQDAYDEYNDTDKSGPIKNTGGNYGGGSETLVVE